MKWKLNKVSLVPKPEEEEEEKGTDFSCLRMRLIAVFPPPPHTIGILPYTCVAILILSVILSVDLS